MLTKSSKAFTLLELSIIIGIIGILLGMAVASKEFVRHAKMKKLMNEINDMEVAVKNFYNIYHGIPGDLRNATSFFDGVQNGDGDDKIEYQDEAFNALLQMKEADLIAGSYSLNEDSYAYRSRFTEGAVMRLVYSGDQTGFMISENVIQIGKENHGDDAIFTPEEAEIVDRKFDNSIPTSGYITYRVYGTTTALSCTNNTDRYYVASREKGCNLVINLDFL